MRNGVFPSLTVNTIFILSDEVKGTKHRYIKAIGNFEKHKADGIENPIAYYKKKKRK